MLKPVLPSGRAGSYWLFSILWRDLRVFANMRTIPGGIVQQKGEVNFVRRVWFLPVLALFWALLAPPASAEYRTESIDNDFQGEIEAAADEDKYLVLFFHQAGCPYCDKMRARVHPAPSVMDYYSRNFVMIESNIKGNLDVVMPDGTETNEVGFARKLRVRATPVFMFFDKDGAQALRTTGYLDEQQFLLAGKYVVDGVHKTGKSFFRYIQEQR